MINSLSSYLNCLEDVTATFKPLNAIDTTEYFDIFECVMALTHEYLIDNINMMANPYFHTIIWDEIYDMLSIQCAHLLINDKIEMELQGIINNALTEYFTTIIPRRSYSKTFIRSTNINIDALTSKLEYLRNVPQPAQRTGEWYEFRYNLLTASTAWKALDTPSTYNSLIYEKCQPLNIDKYNHVNTSSPFHHGTIYEPISIAIYEKKYGTTVEDFGCIKDERLPFLGASPDGINVNPASTRYGRMLEVKNIVNRVIDGVPKKEYWIQMQIQMNVCQLNECDFLETKFTEYENKEAFTQDGSFRKTQDGKLKGIFIYFIKDGKPYYEYPPIGLSEKDFNKWETEIMEKNNTLTWNRNIYWKLDIYSCVLVLRNKVWFDYASQILAEIWNTIEKERISGHEHRAPKRTKKKPFESPQIKPFTGCLLKIESDNIILNPEAKSNIGTDENSTNDPGTINNARIIEVKTETLSSSSDGFNTEY